MNFLDAISALRDQVMADYDAANAVVAEQWVLSGADLSLVSGGWGQIEPDGGLKSPAPAPEVS